MSDHDALDERLRAVERALTDEDHDLADLADAAELDREVDALSARLDEVEDRLDRLDAATQALRGYVGNVRAVNDAVERRADAALAKAEALEVDRDPPDAGSSESADCDAGTSPRDRPPSHGQPTSCDQSTSRNRSASRAQPTAHGQPTSQGRTTGREHDCACECASGARGRAAADPQPRAAGEPTPSDTERASAEVDDAGSGLLARLVGTLTRARP